MLRIRAYGRPAVTTTSLLLLYFLMPLGDRNQGPGALTLIVAAVFFAVLLTWQVRQIATSENPRMRAVEALSLSVPLFLLAFAAAYFATARSTPASFTEALSRTDALYFTVTVFASIGFGDIAPVTEGARVLVMIQMIGDLILVGVVARVIVGAVKVGLRRRQPGSQPD
jgi:glucan phosphoethanolaminetransferase (alkaline phosphatase superfamily)